MKETTAVKCCSQGQSGFVRVFGAAPFSLPSLADSARVTRSCLFKAVGRNGFRSDAEQIMQARDSVVLWYV